VAQIVPFPSPRLTVGRHSNSAFICSQVPKAEIAHEDQLLRRLLDDWRALRGDRKVPPRREGFLPEVHLKGLMGFTHVVDCRASDPLDYAFRLFGSNVELFGKDFTRHLIGDLPDGDWARQTAADYQHVVKTGCPLFSKIKVRIDYKTVSYTRLILPFTDDQDQVVQLIVCLNRRPLPELGELPH
jgi:hypothetical protein